MSGPRCDMPVEKQLLVLKRRRLAEPADDQPAHDFHQGGDVVFGLIDIRCPDDAARRQVAAQHRKRFFVQETGLPGSTPGLSLSVKCLVEVFVIFGSVRLAERIGIRQVLVLASVLAATSMLLFTQVTELWHVIAVSVMEGVYYGLFAGVSISFVQSFAPDRPGRATAIYMNSLFLGGMIGSVSMGIIASATDFKTVLYVAACSSVVALIVLMATLRIQPGTAQESA